MKMVKCTKVVNHFYDGDTYDSCPHCLKVDGKTPPPNKKNKPTHKVSENDQEDPKKDSGKKGLLSGLFGNQKAKEEKKKEKNVEENEEPSIHSPKPQKKMSNTKTHSLWQDVDDESEEETDSKPVQEPLIEPSEIAEKAEKQEPEKNEEETEAEIAEKPIPSVSKQINRVALTGSIKDIKTVAYYGFEEDIEPIAGWLVVTGGDDKGTYFEVKCGRTCIGRNGNGQIVDVSLDKDTTVSRGAHATIIYDTKKRRFLIKSNDGKTSVYVNDEILLDHAELKLYDRMSLGATELIFVPLCSEDFSWDD